MARNPAQLSDEPPPVDAVGQQPVAEHGVEGPMRIGEREQIGDLEPAAPGRGKRREAEAAGGVAAHDRHLVAGIHQRRSELRMPTANIEHRGAHGKPAEALAGDPPLQLEEPLPDRTREAPGVRLRGGFDVRILPGRRGGQGHCW